MVGWVCCRWPRASAFGEVFCQKEAGFAGADDVDVSVSVDIDGDGLDAAAHAATVVDDVSNPLDAAVAGAAIGSGGGWNFAPLVPVEADGIAGAGIGAVVSEVALAGDQVGLTVSVDIDELGGVGLRPGAVDDVLEPLSVGGLLVPREAVVMGHTGEHVFAAVAVDVEQVHEAELGAAGVAGGLSGSGRARCGGEGASAGGRDGVGAPVERMELPIAGSVDVGGSLKPALRGEDVVAAIAVHVADTDAVAVALVADDVLDEFAVDQLEPGGGHVGAIELGEEFLCFAVVVEIDEEGEFGGATVIDLVHRPRAAGFAGVFEPDDVVGEVGELDDVGPAVAVDIHWQVAEVVDVAAEVVDLAERMPGPVGRLVPAFAGDDVELAVVVEVCHGAGFAISGIDHGDVEGDVRGPAGSEDSGGGKECRKGGEKGSAHVRGTGRLSSLGREDYSGGISSVSHGWIREAEELARPLRQQGS
jgi:hypothetical protein